MFGRRGARGGAALLAMAWTASAAPVEAAPAPRPQPVVGSIVDARGEAEIALVELPEWRLAEVDQGLLTGDDLRTGALGGLALLFTDRTQIRVHRNTTLRVTAVAGEAPGQATTLLDLLRGRLWSRAAAGGDDIEVRTPAATAAIRGTDWSLEVDANGRTVLIVLDGEVVLVNPQGSVTVGSGEAAVAEVGAAPSRLFLARPAGRPQLLLYGDIDDVSRGFGPGRMPVGELRRQQARLQRIDPAGRSASDWLDAAEISIATSDLAQARAELASALASGASGGRVAYVEGLLADRDGDHARAARLLRSAAPGLDPQRRDSALATAYLALVLARQPAQAAALRRELGDHASSPELTQLDAAVEVFSGDAETALGIATEGVQRFPDDAQLRLLAGQLMLLLDRRDELKALADETVAMLPDQPEGWELRGHWLADVQGDYRAAIVAFREAEARGRAGDDSLNELALAYYALDETRQAEALLRRAIDKDAHGTAARANLALLLLDQSREAEAEPLIARLRADSPGFSTGLLLEGRLAFQRGDIELATRKFLAASTADPGQADAVLLTAIGLQAQEDFAGAADAVDDAIRTDPYDPAAPLVGAVFARDLFDADRSIELAREADRRIQATPALGIDQIDAARGGAVNVGAAFSFLGLDAWGDLYAERVFDPLDAGSLFFRGAQSADDSARFSSNTQGFLLDPLGVAGRLRYTDVLRRPFTDVEVGGRIGSSGGARQSGTDFNLEMLRTGSIPYALSMIGTSSDDQGDGPNAGGNGWGGALLAGLQLTPYDSLLVAGSRSRSYLGVPGADGDHDPDDASDSEDLTASLAYSHAFSARNVLMTRLFYEESDTEARNGSPFGLGLDDRVYSLLTFLGREDYAFVQSLGLNDASGTPCQANPALDPLLVVDGGICGGTALPLIDAARIDDSVFKDLRNHDRRGGLQLRHALDVGPVTLSYGAELTRRLDELKLRATQFREIGTGRVFVPTLLDEEFPFGEAVVVGGQTEADRWTLDGHLDLLWSPDRDLRIEAGLFPTQRWDDGDRLDAHPGPRAGIAWAPIEGHWLRAAYRDQRLGPGQVTLAPVETLGLGGAGESLSDDGRSRSIIGRWDAEWSRHLYTGVELRRDMLHDIVVALPRSFDVVGIENGRIDRASLTVNSWLTRGIGLFARGELRETDRGGSDGGGLPLIGSHALTAGAAWVHPSSLQVTLSHSFEGDRPAIGDPDDDLDDFNSTDLSLSLEPFRRRLALQLSLLDLFDLDNEIGDDVPGPGRTLLFGARYRF
ncbi:MAG TPA: FecR domain-containing protein [Geminicoccaceae bacterium]|nr:FecR domain-containing protein [Geminicoccus sp.]HMU51615.1 FecR domain-containing protein [Geminicoccaceae bacterium]